MTLVPKLMPVKVLLAPQGSYLMGLLYLMRLPFLIINLKAFLYLISMSVFAALKFDINSQ